jgi:sugar lactone lactonase YvrE
MFRGYMKKKFALANVAWSKSLALVSFLGGLALIAPSAQAQGYTITTVAGGGNPQDGVGDNGLATNAFLQPQGLALDNLGNLYIADLTRIRRVSTDGIIATVAGNGSAFGALGDGNPATSATIQALGVAVDAAGNLYIADAGNNRIRKVSSDGIISTYAGGGTLSPASANGGPATSVVLQSVYGEVLDSAGNLYFSDIRDAKVYSVSPSGTLTIVAGGGFVFGDGGPAAQTFLFVPEGLALDTAGNVYIADAANHRVRKVSTNGLISTYAGSDSGSFSGDGGPATKAGLNSPSGVTFDSAGNLFINDSQDERVRMVTPDGTISTVAGNGLQGFSGDGGPALSAMLNGPYAISSGNTGLVYIADRDNSRVRLLTPATTPGGETPSIKSNGVQSAGAFGGFSARSR